MSYPKQLIHDDGRLVLAKQSVHESDLRRLGFHDAPEKAPTEPTPCPNCAILQAQIDELKAKPGPDQGLSAILVGLPNKAALVAYGKEHYGLDLEARDNRDDLEAAILAADAAKKDQE